MLKGISISSNLFLPDFLRMTRPPEGNNFTCPQGRLTFNNGRIRLDPTFYEYRYCVCDADFYGGNGLCKKCMDGGNCPQFAFTESDDLRPNIMTLRSGYWPSPNPNNATHLVKCPVSAACNPSGSCTCRLDTSSTHTNVSHRPLVRGKAARSLISIAVFYIQTMDFMVSSANVWPQQVVAAQNYLSSYWNLYFPSLSCDLPSLFTPVVVTIFYVLISTGNGRDNGNFDQSGNGECDTSAREDESSGDNDRSHLLPVDVPMDDAA
ncbi:hypothetical protein ACROYT_G029299 [Oculina patagonica]